jgi:hypothetical protein
MPFFRKAEQEKLFDVRNVYALITKRDDTTGCVKLSIPPELRDRNWGLHGVQFPQPLEHPLAAGAAAFMRRETTGSNLGRINVKIVVVDIRWHKYGPSA